MLLYRFFISEAMIGKLYNLHGLNFASKNLISHRSIVLDRVASNIYEPKLFFLYIVIDKEKIEITSIRAFGKLGTNIG